MCNLPNFVNMYVYVLVFILLLYNGYHIIKQKELMIKVKMYETSITLKLRIFFEVKMTFSYLPSNSRNLFLD